MNAPKPPTNYWLVIVKVTLAAGLLTLLVVQIQNNDGFARLTGQEKRWSFLFLGLAFLLLAVPLSFVRWYVLVRALKLDFRLIDAFRIGSLGYALNFVALGIIGGDLFKAIFIARDQPGRRTEAAATVLADRATGLFTMLLLASLAILIFGLGQRESTPVNLVCRGTLLATMVAVASVLLLLFLPNQLFEILKNWAEKLPGIGRVAVKLLSMAQAYRSQKRYLLVALLISFVSASVYITSYYWVSRGLPIEAPTLAEHFVCVPLALLTGVVPLTPSGFGTLELAFEGLFRVVPAETPANPGDGSIVAISHRLGTILVAALAVLFYLTWRKKVPLPHDDQRPTS